MEKDLVKVASIADIEMVGRGVSQIDADLISVVSNMIVDLQKVDLLPVLLFQMIYCKGVFCLDCFTRDRLFQSACNFCVLLSQLLLYTGRLQLWWSELIQTFVDVSWHCHYNLVAFRVVGYFPTSRSVTGFYIECCGMTGTRYNRHHPEEGDVWRQETSYLQDLQYE